MIYDLILCNAMKVNMRKQIYFRIIVQSFLISHFHLELFQATTGFKKFFRTFVHSKYIEILVNIDTWLKAGQAFL